MSKPIINFIYDDLKSFIDKFIVHIPEETKQLFAEQAEALASKAITATAKGVAEGIANKDKTNVG